MQISQEVIQHKNHPDILYRITNEQNIQELFSCIQAILSHIQYLQMYFKKEPCFTNPEKDFFSVVAQRSYRVSYCTHPPITVTVKGKSGIDAGKGAWHACSCLMQILKSVCDPSGCCNPALVRKAFRLFKHFDRELASSEHHQNEGNAKVSFKPPSHTRLSSDCIMCS